MITIMINGNNNNNDNINYGKRLQYGKYIIILMWTTMQQCIIAFDSIDDNPSPHP